MSLSQDSNADTRRSLDGSRVHTAAKTAKIFLRTWKETAKDGGSQLRQATSETIETVRESLPHCSTREQYYSHARLLARLLQIEYDKFIVSTSDNNLETELNVLVVGRSDINHDLARIHEMIFKISFHRWKRDHDKEDLCKAIQAAEANTRAIPEHLEVEKLTSVYRLSLALTDKFYFQDDFNALEQCIDMLRAAITHRTMYHPRLAEFVAKLAHLCWCRASKTKAEEDVDSAIMWAEDAVRLCGSEVSSFRETMRTLCISYEIAWRSTNDRTFMERSIGLRTAQLYKDSNLDCQRKLLVAISESYAGLGRTLSDTDAVKSAVNFARLAKAITPPEHDLAPNVDRTLSSALLQHGEVLNNIEDIQESVLLARSSLGNNKPGRNPSCYFALQLADTLRALYERSADLLILEQCICACQDACCRNQCPSNIPAVCVTILIVNKTFSVLSLAGKHRTPLIRALRRALIVGLNVASPRRLEYGLLAYQLASLLQRTLPEHGCLEILTEAICFLDKALSHASASRECRTNLIYHRGILLLERSVRTGCHEDLKQAIVTTKLELSTLFVDHEMYHQLMDLVAGLLCSSYHRSGAQENLQESIALSEQVLEAAQIGSEGFASASNNLSLRLMTRYRALGLIDDARRARFHSKNAIETATPLHPNHTDFIIEHATGLDPDQEDECVQAYDALSQKLVDMNEDDPGRKSVCRTMATISFKQWSNSRQLFHLDRAINSYQEGLRDLEDSNQVLGPGMTYLSRLFFFRWEILYDDNDLNAAIRLAERANALLPEDHIDRAETCQNLAVNLKRRSFLTDAEKDYRSAAETYLRGARAENSPPLSRIRCSKYAAEAFYNMGEPESALQCLEIAIKLFPKVYTRRLEWKDQQEQLPYIYGIASDAASLALDCGRSAYQALAMLECGTSLVMSSMINCRNDLSDLREAHPDLASTFDSLRMEIDTPLPHGESNMKGTSFEAISHRRKEACDQLDDTLRAIRAIPRFSTFLLCPTEHALKKLAEPGPIVIVSFAHLTKRTDTILVTPDYITAIKGLGFTYAPETDAKAPEQDGHTIEDDTKNRKRNVESLPLESLYVGTLKTLRSRNKRFTLLLKQIWEDLLYPILTKLNVTPYIFDSGSEWPTVCWILRGYPYNILPLHAAGDHSLGSTANTISHVISTYAPSIKGLIYARERSHSVYDSVNPHLLLVGMAKSPDGLPDLNGVTEEIANISDTCIEAGFDASSLSCPSVREVLDILKVSNAVHFACHGITVSDDPSSSHLVLCQPTVDSCESNAVFSNTHGSQSPDTERQSVDALTVASLAMLPCGPTLACLTACSTARNSDNQTLGDEAIHVTSALLLSGYSHVLGTMWDSEEEACSEIAVAFWKGVMNATSEHGRERATLLGEDVSAQRQWGHRVVRIAAHNAVLSVRRSRTRSPLSWASFACYGA
jgi:tetratricopeptide (TPR) repeat protein